MGLTPGIAIVTRPTRLEGMKRKWGTVGQVKFRLRQAHAQEALRREPAKKARSLAALAAAEEEATPAAAAYMEYEEEDSNYQKVVERIERDLDLGLPVRTVDREFLPNFEFGLCAVVVVVGQDGLVANAAKYVEGLPIVAVNPDPERFDGVLLPFSPKQVRLAVQKVLDGKPRIRSVTLAETLLNDGQKLLAFNDFFLGAATHVSARYVLEAGGRSEPQSSSGILVSTGAGSTGWLSSVFNMVHGVSEMLGTPCAGRVEMKWEDRRLAWVVREPFISRRSQAGLVAGMLEEKQELIVESLMPDDGVIFSDGVGSDFLAFNSGVIARVRVSDQRANLVVP
jgi:NAD kinase